MIAATPAQPKIKTINPANAAAKPPSASTITADRRDGEAVGAAGFACGCGFSFKMAAASNDASARAAQRTG
jgi:hypothetical protein